MITKGLRESDEFQSHELSLIAALIAWDFPLVTVNKSSSKKVIFTFFKTTELLEAVESYWNDTKQVSPKKYFNALREAKSRIYGS